MTIKLNIDRESLTKLFEENPEFEVELASSVTNFIIEKFYEKNVKRILEKADPILFAKALDAAQKDEDIMGYINEALEAKLVKRHSYANYKPSPQLLAAVEAAVETNKLKLLNDASTQISVVYGEQIKAAVDARFDNIDLDAMVGKRVEFLSNQYITKAVDERFEQRMADFKAMFK